MGCSNLGLSEKRGVSYNVFVAFQCRLLKTTAFLRFPWLMQQYGCWDWRRRHLWNGVDTYHQHHTRLQQNDRFKSNLFFFFLKPLTWNWFGDGWCLQFCWTKEELEDVVFYALIRCKKTSSWEGISMLSFLIVCLQTKQTIIPTGRLSFRPPSHPSTVLQWTEHQYESRVGLSMVRV